MFREPLAEHRLTEYHLTEWPLAEWPFDRTSFNRKFILPKGDCFFSENGHLTESTFDKKCHLTKINSAEGRLTENGHLTESFY
jgi:hypothetical protein